MPIKLAYKRRNRRRTLHGTWWISAHGNSFRNTTASFSNQIPMYWDHYVASKGWGQITH